VTCGIRDIGARWVAEARMMSASMARGMPTASQVGGGASATSVVSAGGGTREGTGGEEHGHFRTRECHWQRERRVWAPRRAPSPWHWAAVRRHCRQPGRSWRLWCAQWRDSVRASAKSPGVMRHTPRLRRDRGPGGVVSGVGEEASRCGPETVTTSIIYIHRQRAAFMHIHIYIYTRKEEKVRYKWKQQQLRGK